MSTVYIRDSRGKILALVHSTANQTYLHDFKTNKVIATYRDGKTVDLIKNQTVNGNQLLRFVRG